ncbi:uncharacterized protein LOC143863227 [Tasmannia lanceolata]|uniref:uncharacterized protein LOC143863227 n=1 Tax=Tasmannia lanceolata TaxID=3420 RepID=UPI0040649EC2
MTVRFKFRSSVDFDSVEIDGRSSISVRDLRAKIIKQKNLKIFQDFDLVISDAESGRAYEDENFLIPDGSSVIIKRVPAGRKVPPSLPNIASIENSAINHTGFFDTIDSSPSANVDMDNFDDFGVDLYPVLEASLSDSDPDAGMMNCIRDKKAANIVPRCSEPSISRYQKFVPSDLSEASSRGILKKHSDMDRGIEGDRLPKKSEEQMNLEEVDTSTPTLPNTELPAELRCSLCNTIFKEAVMIPCCQHSFCDKCIRLVLVEKERCPKCSSTKCRLDDLLPNVSLRQAIEHFLESQVIISGSNNILPKYAPDGESGVQVKEVSCAISILQREPLLPHSPSATGKESNQVMAESACESRTKNNGAALGTGSRIIRLNVDKSVKSASSPHNIKQIKNGDEALESMTDFQGDSQPFKLSHAQPQKDEASKNKKGLWVNTSDGSGSFMHRSRSKKWDRNCYNCGSPDHLVRDCPAACSPYHMLQTGDSVFPGGISTYGPSYWQGASLPHVRPFTNIYGAPGMMPFDPSMVPVSPFAVPPYMPPMYAGLSVPCRFMSMGGVVPPMMAGAERLLSHAEFLEFQDSQRRREVLNEHPQREQANVTDDDSFEFNCYNKLQRRSHDHKSQVDREIIGKYSEDSENWRSYKKRPHGKHSDSLPRQRSGFASDGEDAHSVGRKNKGSHLSGSDHKACHSDKSNVEQEDMSDSSNWHSRERLKHHRTSSKKHSERVGHSGSSSRKSHHRKQKERSDDQRRVDIDVKKHSRKHHSHLENGAEPSSSSEWKRQRREKESSHSSRHSRHKVKTKDDQDRWEMVDGLDQEHSEDYHYYKRKRTH